MVDFDIQRKLMISFPFSFINAEGEVILHRYANEYFSLRTCETELDVKCKVLEWCSRGAYKTEPYRSKSKNREFHEFMLEGINYFLGTNFTKDDMEVIYTYLGNACNHKKTITFINSNYDMSVLTGA